jgi:hypothetical protein
MKKASPFLALSYLCMSLAMDGKPRVLFAVSAAIWASTAVVLQIAKKEHRRES